MIALVCACNQFSCYPATCGPKGHGSGLPLPRQRRPFFRPQNQYPVPNYNEPYRGSLTSFPPVLPDKGKPHPEWPARPPPRRGAYILTTIPLPPSPGLDRGRSIGHWCEGSCVCVCNLLVLSCRRNEAPPPPSPHSAAYSRCVCAVYLVQIEVSV